MYVFLACSNTTQILFLKERKTCLSRESRFSASGWPNRRPFRKGENIGPGRIRQASMRCVPVYSDSRLDLRIPDAKLPKLRHAATRVRLVFCFDSPPARPEFGRTLRIICGGIDTAQGMPNSTGYGRSRHMQMQQTPVLIFPSARCIYVPFSRSLFRGWGSTDCIDSIRSDACRQHGLLFRSAWLTGSVLHLGER